MLINKQYNIQFLEVKDEDEREPTVRTVEANVNDKEVVLVIRDSRYPDDSDIMYLDFESLHALIGILLQAQASIKKGGRNE